jgi:hypothetical protein
VAPKTTLSPLSVVGIDHHRAAETVLDVGDLRLDLAWPFFGGRDIRTFSERVAVQRALLDRIDDGGHVPRFLGAGLRSEVFDSLRPASAILSTVAMDCLSSSNFRSPRFEKAAQH